MKKRNSVDNRVDFETRFPTADETMKTWLADGAERRRLSRRRVMRRAAVGLGLVGLSETVRRVAAEARSPDPLPPPPSHPPSPLTLPPLLPHRRASRARTWRR